MFDSVIDEAQLPGGAIASDAFHPVALVHDYLLTLRGAERTFAEMAKIWRGAPIFTSLHDRRAVGDAFAGHTVRPSGLQRLGAEQSNFRALLPLFPQAFERMSMRGRDLVVSSSSAFAHGVRPDDDAVHVCYCHSPFRYAWHERDKAMREVPHAMRPAMRTLLKRIRRWDRQASENVTHYVANSEITRYRIADCYGRDAEVIHPPVDVARFGPPRPHEDFFLYVGELASHKRVEVAIGAARKARRRLRVVGGGPEKERLAAVHGGSDIEFLGRVSDSDLTDLYARATALVMPNVEEFGITAVEAQGAGRPVVAVGRGGALETVVDGITGVLVPGGEIDQLAEVLAYTDFDRFDARAAVANARRFSALRFRKEFRGFVERARLG